MNLRDPSGRLARWALRLQEYDFVICYKSGRRHADADCLSRMPLPTTECDADNFDQYIAFVSPEFPDMGTVISEQHKDESLQPLFAAAQESPAPARNRFYLRDGGALYKKSYSTTGARYLLVVPKSLRSQVLYAMHDDPTSGHLGSTRTLYRAQERFYWPKMRKDIEQYVASCSQCQRYKRPPQAPHGLLQPVPLLASPLSKLA